MAAATFFFCQELMCELLKLFNGLSTLYILEIQGVYHPDGSGVYMVDNTGAYSKEYERNAGH